MIKFQKEQHIGCGEYIRASKKHLSYDTPMHFHEFYELEFILSGNGKTVFNGEELDYDEGVLFFMTPLDCHSVNTKDAEIFNVMFTEQFIDRKYIDPFLGDSARKHIKADPSVRPFIITLLTEIADPLTSADMKRLLLSALILKLHNLLGSDAAFTMSDSVAKMHYFTVTNFTSPITLNDAARYANLAPSYASALFKKEMQVNFKTFVDSLRFDLARKLLLTTNDSVSKICEAAGFKNVPNFIRRFKRVYGMPPIEFRRLAASAKKTRKPTV